MPSQQLMQSGPPKNSNAPPVVPNLEKDSQNGYMSNDSVLSNVPQNNLSQNQTTNETKNQVEG